MSKFKRALSMLLAIVMVFGSFSCLSAVVAPKASAVEGTSKIKKYADLAAQYDNFVYIGSEIYEVETADGTLNTAVTKRELTDYYVDAGQLLEERIYMFGDFYFGSSTYVVAYDNKFFDVTQVTTTAVDASGYSTAYGGVVNTEHPLHSSHELTNLITSADCATEGWMKSRSGYTADILAKYDYVQSILGVSGNASTKAFVFESEEHWLVSWTFKVKEGLADGTEGWTGTMPGFWNCGDLTAEKPGTGWQQRKGSVAIHPGPITTEIENTVPKSSNVNYQYLDYLFLEDLEHTFTIGANPNAGGGDTPSGPVEGVSKIKKYADLAAQYDNFVYIGSEIYEIETADGTLNTAVTDRMLTDYYVDAGQLLEERIYMFGDFYFGSSTYVVAYDNKFFDVTQVTTTAVDASGYSTAYGGVVNTEHPLHSSHELTNLITSADCATEGWMKSRSGYTADILAKYDYVQSILGVSGNASTKAFVFESEEHWLVSWTFKVKEGLADGTEGWTGTMPGFWNCGDLTAEKPGTGWQQRKGSVAIHPGPITTEIENTVPKSSNVNYQYLDYLFLEDLEHTFTIGANPNAGGGDTPSGPVEGVSKIKKYADLAAQYDNFVYIGSEIYEIETADGTLNTAVTDRMLTDYYVDAGQLLEERIYMFGDFYFGSSTYVVAYDNKFFDVTQVTTTAVDASGYSTAYGGVVNTEHPLHSSHELTNLITSADCATEGWMKSRSGYTADILAKYDYVQSILGVSGNASTKAFVFESEEHWLVSWTFKVKEGLADGTEGWTGTMSGFWNCGDLTADKPGTGWQQRKGSVAIHPGPITTEIENTVPKSSNVNYQYLDYLFLEDLEHTFTIGKAPAAGSTYTATFKDDNGVFSTVTGLKTGDSIAEPTDEPTKDGYTFKGWALETAPNVTVEFPQTMGSANVTYVAVFEKVVTYTATFVSNGNVIGTAEYAADATITFPDAGTKKGYSFAGWSPANKTMPAADTTFTAQWDPNNYTVYFYAEKGAAVYETANVFFDGAYKTPTTPPSKTGYTFNGWVDANGAAIPSKHTVESSVSYYADWKAGTFTATFKANDGKFLDGNDTYTTSVVFGQPITPPADPTRTGYDFTGWSPAVGNMTEENMTFTAQWKPAKIAVYIMNGYGGVIEELEGSFGSQISPTVSSPTREGYVFAGWTYEDGSVVNFPITLGSEAVYVYATWNANKYYINFYGFGGGEDSWIDGGNQYFGEKIVAPTAPEVKGYIFDGWYDADGNPMPETVPAIENQNYYAKYDPIMYKATFDADGGIFAENGEGIYVYEDTYNSTIVKPANPTKVGYTFNKWSPTVPTKLTKDATYKALWNIQSFTIEYYVDDVLAKTETYQFGAEITAWQPTLDAGVSFSGWGDQVPATMPAENLKVYGRTGAETFTVTFTINGEVYKKLPFAFGSAIVAPEYEADEGYTFSGWDVPATMPAENITIDATETINTYTVYFYMDLDAAEPYTSIDVVYGAALEIPEEDPVVLGKEFIGWTDAAGNDLPGVMPAKDINAYADWSDIEYVVEFVDADGEIVYEDMLFWGDTIAAEDVPEVTLEGNEFKYWVVNGKNVTLPVTINEAIADNDNNYLLFEPEFGIVAYEVIYYVDGIPVGSDPYDFGVTPVLREEPTKVGYTFSGWKDADGNDIVLPDEMPAYDIEVYGTFVINQYDAKFYVDGTLVATVPTNYGKTPEAPDVSAMKPGYDFIGWDPALAPMGTEAVEYSAVFMAAGNTPYTVVIYTMGLDGEYVAAEPITLTGATDTVATYAPEAKTGFTVAENSVLSGIITAEGEPLVLEVYYARDKYTLTVVVDGETTEKEYYFDAPVDAIADPEKIGHTFTEWSPAMPTTMPAKDMTVEAQFKINQYTISFVDTGDVAYADITKNYGAEVGTIKNPVKTGYTFLGWDGEVPTTIPAEDVVLTAQWQINQYTITFVDTGDVAYEPITQDYNTSVDVPAEPTKTGYTFKGWDVEVPTTMPAVNVTVTAIWEINYYDAIFDINGTIVTKRTAYNAMPEIPDASRIGYTFNGWSPEVTAMPANDVTYVAQYTANTYEVIFDANGGKWKDGDEQKKFDVTFDTAITAPEAVPEREGYNFIGWDHEVGTLTSTGDTFKAVWEQDLGFCRIQKVERVTPVTGLTYAKYEITVKESPVKIQIACTDGSGYSWTYDRNNYKVAGDLSEAGLVSVVSYNAAGAVITAEDIAAGVEKVDHEVWTIVTIIPEGTFKVRAKVNHSTESWEGIDVAYDFIHTYDVVEAEEEMIVSVKVAEAVVKRGTANPVTIVTSDKVARLRITMEINGTKRTVSYTKDSSVVEWKDNGDGTSTWVLNITFTYSGTADEQVQNWTIWYREDGSTKWIETEEKFEVKVTKYAPVVEEEGGSEYAPFTVVSVKAAATVAKATYTPIEIVVTSDATKVRINNQAGKATTYMEKSNNVLSVVDNKDGTKTWTINYRFAKAETATWAVECRGNTWSAITDTCLFTITVTE